MNYAEASKWLKKLGVTAYPVRKYGLLGEDEKLPIWKSFRPPFKANDWMQIARRSGEAYVGGCCGQSSAIQDIVCGWFRNGSDVRIKDLADIAEMSARHEGSNGTSYWEHLPKPLEEIVQDRKERRGEWTTDLWYRLAIIWHIVKDCYDAEVPSGFRVDMTPEDTAVATIDHLALALSFHRVLSEPSPQARAQRLLHLARLVPALRYVLNHVDKMETEPFVGWALIDITKGDEAVCRNSYGMCFFDKREDIDRLLAMWRDDFARRGTDLKVEDRIALRPIRIDLSTEDVVFTGEVERLAPKS